MAQADESSSPIPWPPILLAILALAASILTWAAPVRFLPAFGWLWPLLGILLGAAGIAAAIAALTGFRRAGTTVRVDLPSTALVETGIYRYSRNPIYLGMAAVLVGLAVGFNALWFLLAAAVFVVAVQKLAIGPEEAHLERRFGASYRVYKQRVPRWIGIGAGPKG